MKNRCALIVMLVIILFTNNTLAQEVKINTGMTVESDGTLRFDGAATVWDILSISLSVPSSGKVIPDWKTFPYGMTGSAPYLNWFKPAGIDEMYFVVLIPHDWNEGTDIMPHFHWVPSASGAGVPRWGLQFAWANNGETFPAYTTLYGTTIEPSTPLTLVKDRHYSTSLGAISGTGKTISSMLVCRIFRDGDNAADNYGGLAGALEVGFHYQRNTLGSRDEYTK